jgi:hypothetical protein
MITATRIGLFLLMLAGFPAAAGNWQIVVDNEKVRVETDVATLSRNGDIVKAWEKETFRKSEQAIPGDFYFNSTRSLAQHHCANRTTTYLFKGYYAEDGSEIKAIASDNDPDKKDYLAPDSLEERKLLFACTFKPRVTIRSTPKASKSQAKNPATGSADQAAAKPGGKEAKSATPVNNKATKPDDNKPSSTAKSAGGK